MIGASCILPKKKIVRRQFKTQRDAEVWLCKMAKTANPFYGETDNGQFACGSGIDIDAVAVLAHELAANKENK